MRGLLLLAAAASLTSCQKPAESKASDGAFVGLTSSQATFTLSPDRCILSMLFDNFRIQTPKEKAASAFNIVGGNGGKISAVIRGALLGSGTGGKLALTVGTQRTEMNFPAASDEPFTVEFANQIPSEGATMVNLEATVPKDSGLDLTVDSLDLMLTTDTACRKLEAK